jgi:hypothetical protein
MSAKAIVTNDNLMTAILELEGHVDDLKQVVADLARELRRKKECSFVTVPHIPEHTVHRDPLAVMKALERDK